MNNLKNTQIEDILYFNGQPREDYAMALFVDGYNCSQAVVLAFSDLIGLEKNLAIRLSASFGGGMGRMREVCGSVSGALIVLGAVTVNGELESSSFRKEKISNYSYTQKFMNNFKELHGSYICRDLLAGAKVKPEETHVPEERNQQYYDKRPCPLMVKGAAKLLIDTLCEIKENSN